MNKGNIYKIDSLQSYIDSVLSNSDVRYSMVFRGQSCCEWGLIASVGRIKSYSKDKEKKLFVDFKQRYYTYTAERPHSDLELLFLAQHYGLPTRLIDWTFNPLIALYFACLPNMSENSNKDGFVFSFPLKRLYQVDELKRKLPSIDDILRIRECKYVIPQYTETRYQNQQSLFMLSDRPQHSYNFKRSLIQYYIKGDCKERILNELAILGISQTFVFPILDNVSKDIMAKRRISYTKDTKGRNPLCGENKYLKERNI